MIPLRNSTPIGPQLIFIASVLELVADTFTGGAPGTKSKERMVTEENSLVAVDKIRVRRG